MTSPILQQVRALYVRMDKKILHRLPELYTEDIQFRDPLHAVNGLGFLVEYFEDRLEDFLECRYEFHHSVEATERGEAVLFWTMHYRHKKIRSGQLLELTGNTHVLFNEKIYYQRDYYDAGALFYEHLPLLGRAIRAVKKRMGGQ